MDEALHADEPRNRNAAVLAVGLMSGTSMDGIDVAVLETDGDLVVQRRPDLATTVDYGPTTRAMLSGAMVEAGRLADAEPGLDAGGARGRMAVADGLVTDAHHNVLAGCLSGLQGSGALAGEVVRFVGFHGQTVLHRPEEQRTWQLGDGAALADRLGIPVVWDFRAADVVAGGEGAPLVPVYHRALAAAAELSGPIAVVNIGGVANVTWIGTDLQSNNGRIGRGSPLLACDVGPGNALIDDCVTASGAGTFDADGALAARGQAMMDIVRQLMDDPYFARPAPKSLDRNHFQRRTREVFSTLGANVAEALTGVDRLPHDVATLTRFTVEAIAASQRLMPEPPRQWIVCGGGAHNATLMRWLGERLDAPVTNADGLGWSSDSMEAEAFAYLAVRSARGLPLTFPGTTGVSEPTAGGVLSKPRRPPAA